MLLQHLLARSQNPDLPFLINEKSHLSLKDVSEEDHNHLDQIQPGDVVALIGDFEAQSILNLLTLIDRKAVIVPLTTDTINDHDYFFETAEVDWVVQQQSTRKVNREKQHHPLIERIAADNVPGLILFSTGTTGRPKAILHDFSKFLQRFETPRPALRTLGFLLFDHIGGINTLLHTMFNSGLVVSISDRSPSSVLEICRDFNVEALPTTPTFLRLLLISGLVPDKMPPSLKVITYGTERMDQGTLDSLCSLLPNIEFRQTFGMSELGILRVKSEASNSLFMKVGGEGVRTRINENVLEIFSPNRMLGYLNAESPFDAEGWYNTKDVVETKGDLIKVVGRTTEVINVGGLKFLASEVERVALAYPEVEMVKVYSRPNPVTGEHVEIMLQISNTSDFDTDLFKLHLQQKLPNHMIPRRIKFGVIDVGHRFKRK